MCTNTNPSYQLRPLAEAAYNEFFFEKSHTNYFQDDPDIGPCVVSIKKEDISLDSYRYAILFVRKFNCKWLLLFNSIGWPANNPLYDGKLDVGGVLYSCRQI